VAARRPITGVTTKLQYRRVPRSTGRFWALAVAWYLVVFVGVFTGATGIVRHRQAAANDPVARQKAFTAADPDGARACALVNDWLSGKNPDALAQAYVVAGRAKDDYIALQSAVGDHDGLWTACAAAGAIMLSTGALAAPVR
jgi:hypothetical protein